MTIDQLLVQLKDKKCRITNQRLTFLNILVKHQQTLLTVDELTTLCRLENKAINATTVYRNIELLSSLNLLYSLNVDRHTVAYKLICHDHHHHHIICSNCGEMVSIDYCPLNSDLLNIVKEKGYELKSHSLDLYGICSKCQQSD